jgi:hypothetical protein
MLLRTVQGLTRKARCSIKGIVGVQGKHAFQLQALGKVRRALAGLPVGGLHHQDDVLPLDQVPDHALRKHNLLHPLLPAWNRIPGIREMGLLLVGMGWGCWLAVRLGEGCSRELKDA